MIKAVANWNLRFRWRVDPKGAVMAKGKNRFKAKPRSRRAQMGQRIRLSLTLLGSGLFLLLLSAVFMFVHDLITQSSYFATKRIEVSGTNRLSPQEALTYVGLKPGVNLLALNLTLVRKQLISHPWVADAALRRVLPNALVIVVKEHRALAVIDLGRKFVMNSKGEIFKEAKAFDLQRLPRITGLRYADLAVDDQETSPAFDAVMNVLVMGQQPGSPLPNRSIKQVAVDRDMGLQLYAFDQRLVIRLGYSQYANKYQRLATALYYFDRNSLFAEIEWIDLRNPERVVINPIQGSSAMKGGEA